MKCFLSLILILSSWVFAAQTYEEALNAAKTSDENFLVFYEGPSWLPETAAVSTLLAKRKIPGISFAAVIPPEALADENFKKLTTKPDFVPYDLPTLALVGPDGFTYAAAEGVTAQNFPQAIASLTRQVPRRALADAEFEKAESAQGLQKAALLGRGLDFLPLRFARQRKKIIEEIQKADTKDISGYGFKYAFQASAFHERTTLKLIAEKKQPELIAQVDQLLSNKVLVPIQRQGLLAAKMQAHRSLDDVPSAVAVLHEIQQLDPQSELGRGAVEYIRILTEPVRLKGLRWEQADNRPHWLPMVCDVSSAIKEPGEYEIEFRHDAGHTRFRQITIKARGKEITGTPNENQSAKVRLGISAVPRGAIELWAEAQGTGWFEGRGEIIVRKIP